MLKLLFIFLGSFLLIQISNANDLQPYIVNGESVGVAGTDPEGREIIKNIGEYPYMVSLDENGGHVCAGTIISSNAVITADHCVHGVDPKILQVRAGTLSIYRHQEDSEQIMDVESITSHPYFRPSDNLNDIAILWLKGHFRFNKFVNKISMSEVNGDSYFREKLTVIGWGSDKKYSRTVTLKKATLEVISLEECRGIFPQYSIPDSMICVVDKAHVQTTCSGDSGGPIIRHNPDNVKEDIFIGIKSGGVCKPEYPTLYADIGQFRSWVLDELRKKEMRC